MDMSDVASTATEVMTKKELEEVVDMCTQAKRIITFKPKDAKELLDQTVVRARVLRARSGGVRRTELEGTRFRQACA